jgi:hypothetical protein
MSNRLNAPHGAVKSSVSQVCSPLPPVLLESSDDYHRVVLMLDAKTRVIAADIQWIIQEQRGGRWFGKYFCRSKEGLLLYAPPVPELLALPDWFPETEEVAHV